MKMKQRDYILIVAIALGITLLPRFIAPHAYAGGIAIVLAAPAIFTAEMLHIRVWQQFSYLLYVLIGTIVLSVELIPFPIVLRRKPRAYILCVSAYALALLYLHYWLAGWMIAQIDS